MQTMNSELLKAYTATEYWLTLAPPLCLKVGKKLAQLSDYCRSSRSLTLITAHNPYSQLCADSVNNEAQQCLLQCLQSEYSWISIICTTQAVDPSGRWPTEEGVLIQGLEKSQAINLAKRFRQHAVVWLDTPTSTPVIVKID